MSEKDSNSSRGMDKNSPVDQIEELVKEKLKLVSEGRYPEANEIKTKIEELKSKTITMRKKEMDNNQDSQNQQLVDLYQDEVKSLSQAWEKQIQEFIEKNREQEERLDQEHQQKMKEYMDDLINKYPLMKHSKQYLNNKKIESSLAKMDKFNEANYYKNLCEKLEKKEIENYEKKRSESIRLKADALGLKQQNEKSILKERYETQLQLMQKQKEIELTQLDLKFKNLRAEMESAFKQEKINSKKKTKLDPALNLKSKSTLNRMNFMKDQVLKKSQAALEHFNGNDEEAEDLEE